MKKIGLYIHIPFCEKICNYCDFTAFQGADSKFDKYVEMLKKEIQLRKNKDYIVDSIFIGGGTPSIIHGKYIYEILEEVRNNFSVLEDIEISIETNPKTIDDEKLEYYKKSKINRISIGVQTFNDKILKELGRNHFSEDAFESINLIQKHKFALNIDLIFGYQNQKISDIIYDLEIIKKINPEHLSYYALIIEEVTKFGALQKSGKLQELKDEKERKMYHTIVDYLNNIGIKQYEISNFAKENHQSQHNKKYWKCQEYLSFGVGSHSYLDNKRFSNTKSFPKYIKDLEKNIIPVDFRETLDIKDMKLEHIIMNMRLLEGFSIEEFNKKFNCDFIKENKKLIEKSLKNDIIKIENNLISFTKKGLDITDNFFVEIEI